MRWNIQNFIKIKEVQKLSFIYLKELSKEKSIVISNMTVTKLIIFKLIAPILIVNQNLLLLVINNW